MSSELHTAYHEAGHAMIALAAGLPIDTASIIPDADSLGRINLVHDLPAQPPPPLTAEQLTAIRVFEAVYAVAGELAEEIAFRAATAGCECDQQTTSAAIETVDGLTGASSWAWRHTVREVALNYLTSSWDAVCLLALVLLTEKSVSGERAREAVGEIGTLNLQPLTGAIAFAAAREAARHSGHVQAAGSTSGTSLPVRHAECRPAAQLRT